MIIVKVVKCQDRGLMVLEQHHALLCIAIVI